MKTNTVVQMNGKRSLAATSSSLDTMQPNEEDYQFMLQVRYKTIFSDMTLSYH